MKILGSRNNYYLVNNQCTDMVRQQPDPVVIQLNAQKRNISIDLNRTAIIVIDMQNDFCTKGGIADSLWGVNLHQMRAPIPPINQLTHQLRQLNVPIIWVNWGNRADRSNLSPCLLQVFNPDGETPGLGDAITHQPSQAILEKNSWGAAIVDELDIDSQKDLFVDKYRMSGFWDTPLDSILRQLDCKTILFAGVNIDQCVFTTLTDANFLGYDTILIEDACATSSPEFCTQAVLYNVRQCFGFTTTSEDLLSVLPSKKVSL